MGAAEVGGTQKGRGKGFHAGVWLLNGGVAISKAEHLPPPRHTDLELFD